jgi:hypothetical protein
MFKRLGILITGKNKIVEKTKLDIAVGYLCFHGLLRFISVEL